MVLTKSRKSFTLKKSQESLKSVGILFSIWDKEFKVGKEIGFRTGNKPGGGFGFGASCC